MAMNTIQGIVARIEADVSDQDLRGILLGLCGVVQSQQEEIQRLGEVAGFPWDGQTPTFCSPEEPTLFSSSEDDSTNHPEDHNAEAVDAGRIDSRHHDSPEAPYSC